MYRIYTKQTGMPPGYAYKLLLMMKLTTIILIGTLMQVSAAGFAQRLNMNKSRASLKEIFKEIKIQTGYNVVWDAEQLRDAKSVKAVFNNADIKIVMESIMRDQSLDYTLADRTIVIKRKEPSLLDKISSVISNIVRNLDVRGKVLDEKGQPLVGATVKVKGLNKSTKTNTQGEFFLQGVDEGAVLEISFLGYKLRELKAAANIGNISLEIAAGELEEVEVVSTGYQILPKERATGSFTIVTEKSINRNVGVNILDRLESIASGVMLNRGLPTQGGANNSKISIRGRSTLFANTEPLIVLDGFPYPGTIDQINPADIEQINILKDAAAASIWGTRASNGVIVLTSKHGRKNQPLAIGLTSTITSFAKPDLYRIPQISSSDFIDMEQLLFNNGDYFFEQLFDYWSFSAAVQVFDERQRGVISSADSASRINALKANDIRSDLNRYLYRNAFYQQHQLNLSGGTGPQRYYVSAGLDHNLEQTLPESFQRRTLLAKNTISLLKERLEISTGVEYSSTNTRTRANLYTPYSPYDRLVDDNGNSLPVNTIFTLRSSYTDTAGRGQLLDWKYRPKDELSPNGKITNDQYRINLGLNLKIINSLSLSAGYQHVKERLLTRYEYDESSFHTRDLINKYSSISGSTVSRAIPLGDIVDDNTVDGLSKTGRVQLNFQLPVSEHHELNAIAGYESSHNHKSLSNYRLYGYDPESKTNLNNTINPLLDQTLYYGEGGGRITTAPELSSLDNVTQSFYSNISYLYKKKYLVSASGRRDESNIFGVSGNLKGVPLWSVGLAYTINEEDFYKSAWLPKLKVRLTYGYNGNVDKTVSGYLTVNNLGALNEWGSEYSKILNPANPNLRWEKVRTWNLGIDFATKNDRISGNVDLYEKYGKDLLGNSILAAQSGITQFRGNNAGLKTTGIDLVLNSMNLSGTLQWRTSILFNYNTDKVTQFDVKQNTNGAIVSGNFLNPLLGYPYYAVFAHRSAGLTPAGSPQGYLNGEISRDFSTITNSLLDPSQLKYFGSASPKFFGSLLNSFQYKNIQLSFNVSYKLRYYFRLTDVFSGAPSRNYNFGLYNFDKRWKNPGDEKVTRVPALVYPQNGFEETFVRDSEDNVLRADHFRLQDVRISYEFSKKLLAKFPIKNLNAFLYGRNIGLLWTKNSAEIDPDYGNNTIPAPLSFSMGINVNFN